MSNPSQPDGSGAPDQISQENLRAFLRSAPSEEFSRSGLPLGTSVPRLPLHAKDFGAADLVVALEQILAAAGGATSLHLLHASSFLLAIVADALEHRLNDPDIVTLKGIHKLMFTISARGLISGITA